MDRRQLIALMSLGIVGAGVGGLVVTSGQESEPSAGTEPNNAPSNNAATNNAPLDDTPSPSTDATQAPTTGAVSEPTPDVDLPNRGKHQPLTDLDGWLQSDVTSLDELRGKVVAVQFWTFGCHNCTATIPHMQALYQKYSRDDFEVVGVHAAEFDYERDTDAIAQAAVDLGVTWPIAVDHGKTNFRAWQEDRRFWPRLFILDRDGNVRYDHIGEGRYDRHDEVVGALIRAA